MHRLVKIKCTECGKMFLPKSERNIFSSRKCFKQNYYRRKKLEELTNIKFPIFQCPNCKSKIELKFDPIDEDSRWLDFRCPFCSILLVSVVDSILSKEKTIC